MFKLESYLSLMCTPKIWVALTEQINNYYDQFLHGRTAVEKVVLMYLLEERKKERRNLSCAKLLGGKLRKDIQLQRGISVDIVMLRYAKCSASMITTVQTLELKSF